MWAPAITIGRIRVELEGERSTASYAKRKHAEACRREKVQSEYVEDFFGAVVALLDFHPNQTEMAQQRGKAVTEHATPVGSGTVARTKRIPVEQRAEAAVIAWMRHHTTAYDSMKIARVKGKRREVRRMLAQQTESPVTAFAVVTTVSFQNEKRTLLLKLCPLGNLGLNRCRHVFHHLSDRLIPFF